MVLGLIEQVGPATPYDLKRMAQASTINFWSVPHTQLYGECARLAAEGLLSEQREGTGRRRRIYRLANDGRKALERWRSEPAGESYEVRDPGTLKLFFGGDPAKLAAGQLEVHRRRLEAREERYEQLRKDSPEAPRGRLLALEAGIGHEREFIRFWTGMLGESAS
jgi:PadR family transcriptional regulator, regulatory protein AphA